MNLVTIKIAALAIILVLFSNLTQVLAQEFKDGGVNLMKTPLLNLNEAVESDDKEIAASDIKVNKLSQNIENQKKFSNNKLDEPKKTASSAKSFDIDKAVRALNRNARGKSSGYCAKYVRLALQAGGLNLANHPTSATDYDKYLPTLGFKKVNESNYVPKKGDVVVTKAFRGTKNHPHGHISMYNGTQWISDFKQKDIWAGDDYRKHKPTNIIFRKG